LVAGKGGFLGSMNPDTFMRQEKKDYLIGGGEVDRVSQRKKEAFIRERVYRV